jgi:hypothetical protein
VQKVRIQKATFESNGPFLPCNSMQVLRHSYFSSDPWGDGGSRRTAQITEILANAGITEEIYNPDLTRIFSKKFAALEGIRLMQLHGIKSKLSKTALTQLGFNYYKREKTFSEYAKRHKLLLWESSRQQNFLMSYAARDNGLKVIALPHNLESLVRGQQSEFTGRPAPLWFEEELQSLLQCQAIFTISREEQYLLKLFGADAGFLPYHPPAAIRNYLLQIRKNRLQRPERNIIFLMGTAGNKPTFDGMLDRIRFFNREVKDQTAELHIGGYLTESLAAHLPADARISLHGSLSSETMAEMLSNCRFCWIHQHISTGALTKIPELMMAGVPVQINADAARSFHNIPGIRVYEDDNDCLEGMQQQLPAPSIPEQPKVHERLFVEEIRRLNKDMV